MMRRKFLALCSGLFVLSVFIGGCASEQELAFRAVESKTHSAVTPKNRDGERHRAFNARVRQGNVDLIFISDSITHGWEGAGREVWQKYYGHRNAVNLGISGDRTQHVLWRLDNGNVDHISPKVAVVMIGTNNHPPRSNVQEISDGIIAVCGKLRTKLLKTKILLLAIFPRSQAPCELRDQLAEASRRASKIADGRIIHYLGIGDEFLEADKSLPKEIMPDYLHLSPKGYQIWARAIEPKLAELMAEKR